MTTTMTTTIDLLGLTSTTSRLAHSCCKRVYRSSLEGNRARPGTQSPFRFSRSSSSYCLLNSAFRRRIVRNLVRNLVYMLEVRALFRMIYVRGSMNSMQRQRDHNLRRYTRRKRAGKRKLPARQLSRPLSVYYMP